MAKPARQAVADTCEVDFVNERKVRRVQKAMKPVEAVSALAETFKLLSDPTRIKIVFALSREELCVCVTWRTWLALRSQQCRTLCAH